MYKHELHSNEIIIYDDGAIQYGTSKTGTL